MNRGTRPALAAFVLTGVAAGCAAHVAPARFADLVPIEEIADDAPIPVPQKRVLSWLSYSDAFSRRPTIDGLDLRRTPDALDVNAIDEVPTSSWFVHPAGGPLGAIRNVVNGPPEPPYLVLRRRPESGRSGLVIIDARGLRYELGRDPPDRPFLRTTAAVVASHLMRAMGYRTPEVSILALAESELRLEVIDRAPPPTEAVREFLDSGPPPTKGLYRVSATRWPVGLDVGLTPPHEPREDDPNDRLWHEDRRTLRALKTVRGWLGSPDFGIDHLRDVYVGAPGKGHLLHYVVGLEGSLGADDARGESVEPRSIDPQLNPTAGENPLRLLITFGLNARVYHGDPRYPFIGDFGTTVRKGDFGSIGFEPTHRLQPSDSYWAAKQMAGISREVIEAAVDDAATPDSATRNRLIEVLDSRRLTVIALAYADVTPCEVVRTEAHAVVLRDAGFSPGDRTSYEVGFVDDGGSPFGATQVITPGGAVFTVQLPLAPYVILRLRVTRNGARAPRELEVHFRGGPDAQHRVGVRH